MVLELRVTYVFKKKKEVGGPQIGKLVTYFFEKEFNDLSSTPLIGDARKHIWK